MCSNIIARSVEQILEVNNKICNVIRSSKELENRRNEMSNKIKIYLDQNILQYDFEGKFSLDTNENIQYIYSDEHFNEIQRWENNKYFEVLERINARKIKCNLKANNKFSDSGILLSYESPKKMYEEYKDTISSSKSAMHLFYPLQVYMFGNKEITNPQKINSEFQNTMNDLFEDVFSEITDDQLKEQCNEMVTMIGNKLEESISDQDIRPLAEVRKKITKENLSNLTPDKGLIIDQIWDLIKEKMDDVSKDQFFGKKGYSFQDDFEYSKFQNVIHLHTILNFIGYWPDEGLPKISKIYGINSDASHLAHSILCDGLLTGDNRMVQKAQAIFSYLDVRTNIYQLQFNSNNSTRSRTSDKL